VAKKETGKERVSSRRMSEAFGDRRLDRSEVIDGRDETRVGHLGSPFSGFVSFSGFSFSFSVPFPPQTTASQSLARTSPPARMMSDGYK
jgi:hypothetical protein